VEEISRVKSKRELNTKSHLQTLCRCDFILIDVRRG